MKQSHRIKKKISTIFTRLKKGLMVLAGCLLLTACSLTEAPYEERVIDLTELLSMIEEKQTFVLLAEREECPFCEALNTYMDETKGVHEGIIVYYIDTTPFHLYREGGNASTLSSDTNDGKDFLALFPFFFYTPTLYQIKDGVPDKCGVGYDENTKTISVWDTTSPVYFEMAEKLNVWDFIKQGQ